MSSDLISLFDQNLILRTFTKEERENVVHLFRHIELKRKEKIYDVGSNLNSIVFPLAGTSVSLMVPLEDGRFIETATVGREGALGGILCQSNMPSFTCSVVQIKGSALSIETSDMENIFRMYSSNWNVMGRYSECLLSQILQSVACNAAHSIEERCARVLLTMCSRLGSEVLPVTQEMLAEMLGVQRTYLTTILTHLKEQGVIKTGWGKITVCDGDALQATACECHRRIHDHFTRVLGASFASDGTIAQFDTKVACEALGGA